MRFNSSKSRVVNIAKKKEQRQRMASGGRTGAGRGCLLFGDKGAGRVQILGNLVCSDERYV